VGIENRNLLDTASLFVHLLCPAPFKNYFFLNAAKGTAGAVSFANNSGLSPAAKRILTRFICEKSISTTRKNYSTVIF